jgi:hypothetical protein
MSGWGDTLIGSKFESVVDQSTGETIMVSTCPPTLSLSLQPGMHAATAPP